MRINRNSTDPAYWEKVLAAHKLKPIEEEQYEFEPTTLITTGRKVTNNNTDFEDLRRSFDSDDQFMRQGHQILKIRTHEHDIPEWTMSDSSVQELIERAFPKWRTAPRQRAAAGRWVRVVMLFYRVGLPISMVADEMKSDSEAVKQILKRIRRVKQGRRADNKGPRMTPSAPLT
jgi:hypothetical protein